MLSPLIQEKPYMAIVSISASTHHLRHLYHHTTNPLLHRHHHCFSPLPQSSFTGSSSSSSSRSAFQEEARRRYARRIQEEYKEEMERVERIRRMQSVFNREKNKYRRGYERWREEEEDGAYHQRFQRDDWYWKTDTSYGRNWSNFKKPETPILCPIIMLYWVSIGREQRHIRIMRLSRHLEVRQCSITPIKIKKIKESSAASGFVLFSGYQVMLVPIYGGFTSIG
ncbi:hypothetical protein LXL04_000309 [Taraxacum kok-saghyz]